MYLLVVCYYSRFIELAKLRSLTTEEVITHLKSMFSRHGVCDIFTSDKGGCYSGQAMQKFMKEYGIKHITSSPRYPLGTQRLNALFKRANVCLRSLTTLTLHSCIIEPHRPVMGIAHLSFSTADKSKLSFRKIQID